jgi:hypothetical protein
MYIERKNDPDGNSYFVNSKGQKFEELFVFVDDKRIVADMVRADTGEGWVDVEVAQVSNSAPTITAGESVDISKTDPTFVPMATKRISGKVKVYVPTKGQPSIS